MDRSAVEGNSHGVCMGHRSLIIAAKATGARCVFDEGYIYSRTEYALAVERMKKNGAGCGQY